MGKAEEESNREKIIRIIKKLNDESEVEFKVLERYTEEDYTYEQLMSMWYEMWLAPRRKNVNIRLYGFEVVQNEKGMFAGFKKVSPIKIVVYEVIKKKTQKEMEEIQKEKEKMQNEEILTRLGLGKDFRMLERYTEEDYTADQLAAMCAEKSAASRKKGYSVIYHRQQDPLLCTQENTEAKAGQMELIIIEKIN